MTLISNKRFYIGNLLNVACLTENDYARCVCVVDGMEKVDDHLKISDFSRELLNVYN